MSRVHGVSCIGGCAGTVCHASVDAQGPEVAAHLTSEFCPDWRATNAQNQDMPHRCVAQSDKVRCSLARFLFISKVQGL